MAQGDNSLPQPPDGAWLVRLLDERFTLSELKDLCFNLSVDFDNLSGSEKIDKVRELTEYFARREMLDELVRAVREARPDILIQSPQLDESRAAAKSTQVHCAYIQLPAVSHSKEKAQPKSQLTISTMLSSSNQSLAHENAANGNQVSVYRQSDTDLVLLSFGDPGTLVHQVIEMARLARREGANGFRAGIHSSVAKLDSDNRELVKPDELVKLTKCVMELGKEGHILSTAHVSELLRSDKALQNFWHAVGKCEIRYHVRVEIYNLCDDATGQFGNTAKPNTATATHVLKEVRLPKELRCGKPGPLTLTFFPDVEYAKISFGFRDGSDLQISCAGLGDEDGAFEYERTDGVSTKVFELWNVKASEDLLETVTIRCFDEADELTTPPVRGRVLVRRRIPEPSGLSDVVKLPLWAWDRFICLSRWRRVLAVGLVLAGVIAVGLVEYWPNEEQKETLKIRTGFWPEPFDKTWYEYFKYTFDHKPDKGNWPDVPSEWTLEQQGNDRNDRALLTHGERIGLSYLDGRALYDFKVKLRFRILENQNTVAWILRAQNRDDYYLVVLTLPAAEGVKATIAGYVYKEGKEAAQLEDIELPYHKPFLADSILVVRIEVIGNTFKHIFKYDLPERLRDDLQMSDDYLCALSFPATLSDPSKYYRWGSLGFRGKEQGDKMKIEDIDITKALRCSPVTSDCLEK